MTKSMVIRAGGPSITLALVCVGCALLAITGPVFHRALGAPRDQTVKVLGVAMPHDEPDEMLVYTDLGTYAVSDRLTRSTPRGEAWFLFRIGSRYRVTVAGAAYDGPWGEVRPTILSFTAEETGRVAEAEAER